MSCNWPLKRISEVANFENNKRIPLKSLDREKRQGIYPYYGASGVVDYIDDFIFDGRYLLISEDGENLRTRNTPIAFQASGKFWVNNHAHILSEKEEGILDYLEYYFSVLNIGAYITGAVQPKLNKANLDKIEIPIPPKGERLKLNNVLNSLKYKVALNSETNQTLEEMAQAIFKSWFVDFDPVKAKINGEPPKGMDAATASLFPEKLVESELGLIPEGWDVGTLSDVAKYCSARTKTDTITLENYISTENMLAEKKGVTAASKLPTAKTVAAYKSGDILVSNIRPYFKKIWLAEGSGGRSNDVLGFESVSANTESYLMNVLYQDTFFEYMTRTSKGAKMPRGDKTAIMNWEMAVPPVELREAFSAIVDKFYQLIPQNRAQNATLESLRDTLLPKLLSGELSLTDSLEVTNV
ncbi:restriction endonuclease subunit S [Vibrio parahaemolyticus]|nr:restriction endonuclease subunit S [Vibrio parahaemolyticus]ELA8103240.1 restriction endonuclease subunit S [Vibrio parahaemolyticus]